MNQLPLLLRVAILYIAAFSSFSASVSFNTSTKAVSPNGLLLTYPTNSAGTLAGITSLAGNESRSISSLSGSGTNYIWDVSAQGSYKLTLAQPLTYIILTNWSSESNAQIVSSLKIVGNGSRSIYFLNSDLSFSTSISTNSLSNGETFFYATWTGDQKDLAQSPEPYLTGLTGNVQIQIDGKLNISDTNTVAQNTWVRVGTTNLGTFKSVTFWPGSNVAITTTNGTGDTNIDLSISATGSGSSPTTTLGDTIFRGSSEDERLGIGKVGQTLVVNPITSKPMWAAVRHSDFTDAAASGFMGAVTANSGTSTITGTGEALHFGAGSASTASSTNGGAGFKTSSSNGLLDSDTKYVFWTFKTPSALSDSADKYQVYAGFGDASGVEATDGAYITYTHDVNSGNWTGKTSNNGVRSTSTNLASVAFTANAWWYVGVEANSTICNFYTSTTGAAGSYTKVAEISSNLPTSAGREFGCYIAIVKQAGSVGTNARILLVDDYILMLP